MNNLTLWVTPLLLIPGLGMLVMSTSARFAQLHNELHHLVEHAAEPKRAACRVHALLARARLFRSALIALYVSIAVLCVSALTSVALSSSPALATGVMTGLMAISIAGVVFATGCLIVESTKVMHVLEDHERDVARRFEEGD